MTKERLLTKFLNLKEILERTLEPPYHLCNLIDRNFSYPEAKEMKEYMHAHKPDSRNKKDWIFTLHPSWVGQMSWWVGEEKHFRLVFLSKLIDGLREEISGESGVYVTASDKLDGYFTQMAREINKPKPQKGKWYWVEIKIYNEDILIRFNGKHGDDAGYGFDINRNWRDSLGFQTGSEFREATNQEVEIMLRVEAVKRGYKPGILIDQRNLDPVFCKSIIPERESGYRYKYGAKNFLTLNGKFIYKHGKWAKILEEKPKKPSELTIPEIQEMMKDLEKEIKDAINEFYNKTDLKIQAIEIKPGVSLPAYKVKLKIEFL